MAITSYKAVVGYYNSAGTPNITTAVTGQLSGGWIPIGAPILTDAYGQCTQMMVKNDATPVVTVSAYTVVTAANPQPPDATWNAQGEPLWIDTTTYLQAYTKGGVVEENVRELWNRTLTDAGLTLAAGSFEEGGTLTSSSQALLCYAYDQAYTWAGSFPKTVPVNSTPDSTGGISAGAWVSVSGTTLRKELTSQGGAGIINGIARPVTWKGFAGGADPTGVRDSTAAFQAANASKSKIYIPAGSYKLTQDVISDPLTSWEMEMGVLFIGGYWLRQVPWLAGVGNNIFYYLERHSRNTFIAPPDGIGVYGSAHTALGGAGGAALGVAGTAINDDQSGSRSSVWALYGSAIRNAGTIGASHGLELDIANLGDERELFPNSMFPNGQTDALWLGSGGEMTQAGIALNASSAAIGIIANDKTAGKTARFLKGIVFGSDSLKGTDGESTGQGIAMALGNRHCITWYNNSNQKTSEILSTLTNAARSVRMTFSDSGVIFNRLSSAYPLFLIENGVDGQPNYLAMRPAAANNPPAIGVNGPDANIDLRLSPKGAGTIRLDASVTPTSPGAASTVGTSGRYWAGGFTQTAFTVVSDERDKTERVNITDAMLDAWSEVDFVQFQYVDRVEAKGVDGARWHFGVIAQRAKEAFERHGLDAHRFGFLCYDEWEDEWSRVQIGDSDEYENVLVNPAGSRYGIRYEEVLVLEAALQRRNYSRLLERVTALESK